MENKFKTVLITGATRGIGFELCRIFLNELNFEKIYFSARTNEKALEVINKLDNTTKLIPLIMDVSDENSVKNAFENYLKLKGNDEQLDVLINNAGAQLDWTPDRDFIKTFDIDINLLDKIYRTNVFSHLIVARTFIKEMSKGARIVNVASGSGEFWDINAIKDFQVGYATSKSAAIMMSKKIAAAAKKYNVYVNSCCPGWCRTSMGGDNASLSAYQGAKSVIASCFLNRKNPPIGHHFKNGRRILLDFNPIAELLKIKEKFI